jgi:hypothetical protein
METLYTDTQDYSSATNATLTAIEPAIGQFGSRLSLTPAPSANSYSITVTSKGAGGHTFTIARDAQGVVSRSCGHGCTGSW